MQFVTIDTRKTNSPLSLCSRYIFVSSRSAVSILVVTCGNPTAPAEHDGRLDGTISYFYHVHVGLWEKTVFPWVSSPCSSGGAGAKYHKPVNALAVMPTYLVAPGHRQLFN
eukprot:691497-Prorocentrum_minimum.AAC.1